MERKILAEADELSPLERSKAKAEDKWLTELFGADYLDQPYHPIPVGHIHLENVAKEIWTDLESEGFFSHSPNYDEVMEALQALNDGYLPKGFIIQASPKLEPSAKLSRADILLWVDGAFKVADQRGFIGPRQLTLEEE